MGFEVDFLPVEAGEKSGDAIAMKIWNDRVWWVIVIDGGYTDDGDALVDHINRYYGTNRVNLAISTHPDADHASGLIRVVEQMDVEVLWMHQPWNRVSTSHLQSRLRRDLDAAKALETAAQKKGIPIIEPFSNAKYENLVYAIGPTESFYRKQLADFDCMPESENAFSWVGQPPPGALRSLNLAAYRSLSGVGQPPPTTLGALARIAAAAAAPPSAWGSLSGLTSRQEDWNTETLDDDCDTSAENNTSVILAINLAGNENGWGMFTGDAGEPGLMSALDWLDATNFKTSRFAFVQIPHHGSEHNISPAVLNRWLGMPQLFDIKTRTAYVSSARKAPKHPSEKVMNAFRRRGAWPYATEGVSICHSSPDAPNRDGWSSLNPHPFYRGAA
jgi:beta-lactamase superfamily II metal-dependent hydrolase